MSTTDRLKELAEAAKNQTERCSANGDCCGCALCAFELNITPQDVLSLIAELASLKAQEPVCEVGSHWNGGFDVRGFASLAPSGTKLYLAAGAQSIPAGYQMVPVEPTYEMIAAWNVAHGSHEEGRPVWKLTVDRQAYYTYKAMLSAAPQAQPVQQEPVCNKDPRGCWSVRCQLGKVCKNAAQEQRKPLSDEQVEQAYRNIYRDIPSDFDHTTHSWIEAGIRYAEAAHGIGEQG